MNTIRVGPDKPALLAQRLVRRLLRDNLLTRDLAGGESRKAFDRRRDEITEVLADEIHQDVVDGTLRR